MTKLPKGTVTFLFTDIEGSTRLLQQLGSDKYAEVLSHQRRLLRSAFQAHDGAEVDTQGDAFFYVFARAMDALEAAISAQRAIAAHPWPNGISVLVRMGVHTGEPLGADAGYVGMGVHRAARICSAANGGQILLSQATRELVEEDLPLGVVLRDLGEHRLKDLARAQRLFQAVAPGLPSEFPPLRTLDTVPNNLPRQLTRFIGREREIAEVEQLLSGTRLLTLTGAGGVGKTRLALEVAAQVLSEHKDGTWLVELAPISDPALVPQTAASTLGIREQSGRPILATLIDVLQPKRLLLLFDNAEYVVEGCAQLSDTLLRACSNLRILVTSRERLAIAGETVWRVPSLSLPDPKRLPPLERLMEFESIRLFVERTKAVFSAFNLTRQNAHAVARICHQLDGLPLGIELAAARGNVLSVEQIAARLDDRFRLLTGGGRATAARHQALQAAIDWSYDLLSERQRILLRRLSIFVGGWTLEAAQAICAGEGIGAHEILDLQAGLINKSLVEADALRTQARYRLLETVRQYGRDRLEEAVETERLQSRHRDYFLNLAEQARPNLRGPKQRVWFDRLELEHDNLRAGLQWSFENGDAKIGTQLALALFDFWWVRGHWSEGRMWLEQTLTGWAEIPVPVRTRTLASIGKLVEIQGDLNRARTLYQEALTLSRERGDKESLVNLLGFLANAAPDNESAERLCEEGFALYRELEGKQGSVDILNLLGAIVRDRGEYDRARSLHEESLALFKQLGDQRRIAWTLRLLGIVARIEGDTKRAQALYSESLTLYHELDDKEGEARSLIGLALVQQIERNYEEAMKYLRESLELDWELGNRLGVAGNMEKLAGLAVVQGHFVRAARLFGAARVFASDDTGYREVLRDRRDLEHKLNAVRTGLGEQSFEAAWSEGRAMTLGQAIDYALKDGS